MGWRQDAANSPVCDTGPLLRPMHSTQYLPCAHQLLNGGGWWEPFSIEAAVVVRRLVDAFHAGNTEHRQTPGELCQFIPAQDRVGFRAACHNWILADSLFVRHDRSALHLPCSESAVPSVPVRSLKVHSVPEKHRV